MKKLLFCLGTRPEAIKLAPLIVEAKRCNFNVKVLNTGQHKDLVKPILDLFKIDCDYWLNIESSSLNQFTSTALIEIDNIISNEVPDYVIVQGDTSSTFTAALAAYNCKVPIVHIEAGLRTGDIYSPYPEEGYRKMISNISTYHFCPTENDLANLQRESIVENCYVVGNTVIDSLKKFQETHVTDGNFQDILITVHRRENQGNNLELICDNLIKIASTNDYQIHVVCHPNPEIRKTLIQRLRAVDNIEISNSVAYDKFIQLMLNSSLIITDSGGIQEEASYLGIPTLVIRDHTERHFQEHNLVSIDNEQIFEKTIAFFNKELDLRANFQLAENATSKIVEILNSQA